MSDRVVKVALVGSGGAGKTTLASRLVTGEFMETMMTVGINIETWGIFNDDGGENVKVALFDLGGQQQFRFFQESLLAGTQMAIILVDLSRPTSLFEVDEWVDMIRHVPKEKWLLVGNKADQPASITENDIKEKAYELGIPYVIVSAKTGQNFDSLVKTAVDMIVND